MRIFLVSTILAVVTLFSFITALRGYQTSLEEADRLFDSQLIEKAKLIANISPQGVANNININSATSFQVWQGKKLIAVSGNSPHEVLGKLQLGFGYQNFSGYRWRTYGYDSGENGRRIIVSERQDIRFSLAENIALKSVLPSMIGLPILACLIWLVVSRGLRPMSRLARELGSKRADDLSPIVIPVKTQELTRIITSSNDLLERLKSSLQREKQFSSDAAHELRTPISSLKIQLHNISHELSGTHVEITEISKITTQLEHVVEQILALYRTSPDEYHRGFQALNLTDLVQQIIAEEYDKFASKEQQIELEGDSHRIMGDEFSLTTLIQNLLSNANKYTPNGGQISVRILQQSEKVVLIVEDSGPGIAASEHERLFQRFYRIGGDRHTSGQVGCGLGLAIVKRIADLYGAEIAVGASGKFATGTTFTLCFPALQTSSQDI